MRRTACLMLFALGCPPPLANTTGFGVDPTEGIHLAGTESTGIPSDESTSSTTGTGSTGDISTGPASTGAEPQPDFGPVAPAGCAGKIDFLFVISSAFLFADDTQDQMLEAIPAFYTAIQGALPEFDTHILVTDADESWGTSDCAYCVEDCDPNGSPPLCGVVPDACDTRMGAGLVFPVGENASNRRCDLTGGKRYITREEPDPLAAFECIATVGSDGAFPSAGESMYEAISPELNGPGGCNEGFLRDDALLVVTIISGLDTTSEGYIYSWTDKLLAAKHGDPDAFLVLVITGDADVPDGVCPGYPTTPNRLRKFAEYVPNGKFVSICEDSFVPFFTDAVTSVIELCDGFIPQ